MTKIYRTFMPIFIMAMILTAFDQKAIAQEKVMFDGTVTWGWPISNTYGGNSFYWWHYASKGVENLGDMPATDWTTPANYWNGTVYLRYEVISQPTSVPFQIQMGIWQDGGDLESVSLVYAKVAGGNGSVLETSLGSPSAWYKVYPTLDFTRPEDIDRIGLVLWTNNASNQRGCIPMAQGWNNSAACADATTLKANFFPMQARITVVACASGTTFSGWDTYTGGTRPPTPTYAIDYINENTTTLVPSTDEYSTNQSTWTSGSGSKITLTPGQDMYFRTKAVSGTPASLIQTLDVPSRPTAPAFTYDAATQQTTQTVSSAYEYADNSAMTGAITGTGTNVSFVLGETRYFRKLATSSAFKSIVQTLAGVSKAATPTYSIDYINETTEIPVPSTDEYSINQSSWTSGTGIKITLTPGTDMYFRTKASGGTAASDIQTLDVPSRSATPTFSYDAANQRTSTTVSSAFEYSDNVAMTSATTGTGAYVSILAETTKYFRRKATTTAFKSNVQTLSGSSSSNIGPEFVIINEIIEYPNTTDNNGFYFFYHNPTMPINWLSSYNYNTGQIYTRYEIISQVSTEPVALQFGIWQRLPANETGTLYENMETQRILNGPGSVVTNNMALSSFWKYNGGVDLTQMDKVWHFGINPYKVNNATSFTQIRSENTAVWDVRNTYWFPMTVRVTVVAVANGYVFSGWENYVGDETYPSYAIDFVNKQTTVPIPLSVEYSIDQNSWNSGTDTELQLTPGQDVYFRKKTAPTYIQHLTVPAQPNQPSFAVDFVNERTSTVISSDFEYANNSNMSVTTTGSGQYVALTPASTIYFRKRATATAFSSNIQTLNVSSKPAAPEITINFIEAKTVEVIPSTIEYSNTENFSTAVSGSGSTIALNPGTSIYFRIKANSSQFKSQVKTLNVPTYPDPPAFGINYSYERTSALVGSDYEYSINSDMTAAQTGSNVVVKITPGTDLYFRKKATTTSFVSGIQHLIVPQRPSPPAITIDYLQEKTVESITNAIHYSEEADFSSTHEGVGNKIMVSPGENLYFKYKAAIGAFTSEIFPLIVPNRPAIFSQMTSPTSQSPIVINVSFPGTMTGLENDDFLVTNGSVSSISPDYVVNILPLASGTLNITLKANAVSPANFASEIFSITYSGATSFNNQETANIKLYPTVSSSQITLECQSCAGKSYYVIDGNGRKVLSGKITDVRTDIQIGNLLPAIYQLILSNDNKNIVFRFIKTSN